MSIFESFCTISYSIIFADVLECTMNPNRCGQFATCNEMSGSYGCSCMTGYQAMAGTSGQSIVCEGMRSFYYLLLLS